MDTPYKVKHTFSDFVLLDEKDKVIAVFERKSILGDTPVPVREHGKLKIMNIEDIISTFEVGKYKTIGWDLNSDTIGWFDVTDVSKHRTNTIFNIQTTRDHKRKRGSSPSIGVTNGHNIFYMFNGEVDCKPSEQLECGDMSISLSILGNDTFSLTKEDFISFLKSRVSSMKTKKTFELIDNSKFRLHSSKNIHNIPLSSNELYFLFGLWTAEGSFIRNGIHITQKTSSHNEYIETLLNTLGFSWYINNNQYVISSFALTDYFKHLGFKSGSENKIIPPFIFDSPEELRASFIKGYLFGDGWVLDRRWPQIKCVSKSRDLIVGLSLLLQSVGIRNSVLKTYKKYKDEYREYWCLEISRTDKFLEKIGQIPLKPVRECEYNQNCFTENYRAGRKYRHLLEDKLALKSIKKITKICGNFDVYDLSVDKCENFVAGPALTLVHNTMTDFVSSLGSRLNGQALTMLPYTPASFIILVGHLNEIYYVAKMKKQRFSEEHFFGAIASLAIRDRINVLWVKTNMEAVVLIDKICKKIEEGKMDVPHMAKKDKKKLRIISLCFSWGIRPDQAKKLIKEFKTIQGVLDATPEQFKKLGLSKRCYNSIQEFYRK
jgi:intein/homing endonuclease